MMFSINFWSLLQLSLLFFSLYLFFLRVLIRHSELPFSIYIVFSELYLYPLVQAENSGCSSRFLLIAMISLVCVRIAPECLVLKLGLCVDRLLLLISHLDDIVHLKLLANLYVSLLLCGHNHLLHLCCFLSLFGSFLVGSGLNGGLFLDIV
jgi:hypothetical protein